MTKRELLLAICESPGYAPEDSSETERNLTALNAEGWVAHRLDGWVATSKALDEYPQFISQADIADPNEGRVIVDSSGRKEGEDFDLYVPFERVEVFVAALLSRLPMQDVVLAAAMVRGSLPTDELTWHAAREITRKLKPLGSPQ